jgi:hypothetical protein
VATATPNEFTPDEIRRHYEATVTVDPRHLAVGPVHRSLPGVGTDCDGRLDSPARPRLIHIPTLRDDCVLAQCIACHRLVAIYRGRIICEWSVQEAAS